MKTRILGVMIGLGIAAAGARTSAAQSIGTSIRIPFRTYVGVNPMGIPFDVGSIEFESAVAPGITLGGLGSLTAGDDDRYLTFEFKARYYPGEVVLRGFSVGLSAGTLRYSTLVDNSGLLPDSGSRTRQQLTAPTIGVLTDYNWLLGTSHRFLVGTGLGAKRILASRDDRARVGDLDRAYLTARFIVGLAF